MGLEYVELLLDTTKDSNNSSTPFLQKKKLLVSLYKGGGL